MARPIRRSLRDREGEMPLKSKRRVVTIKRKDAIQKQLSEQTKTVSITNCIDSERQCHLARVHSNEFYRKRLSISFAKSLQQKSFQREIRSITGHISQPNDPRSMKCPSEESGCSSLLLFFSENVLRLTWFKF